MPFEEDRLEDSFDEFVCVSKINNRVAKFEAVEDSFLDIAACGCDPSLAQPQIHTSLCGQIGPGEVVAIVKNLEPDVYKFVGVSFEVINCPVGVSVVTDTGRDPHNCVVPPATLGWFRNKPGCKRAKAKVEASAQLPNRNEVRVNALQFVDRQTMEKLSNGSRRSPKIRSSDEGAVCLEVLTLS